ncbi:ATP-dependent DNA helicase [Trichonephila clavipes]|nr:ATP-dependent DNA helicase [Trichonephila clavipes]
MESSKFEATAAGSIAFILLILERCKEFESNLDIQKTLQIIKDLCHEEDLDDNAEQQDVANRFLDPNPFQDLYQVNSLMNDDIRLATLNKFESSPLQICLTGPAVCGKTFVIKLLMEINNRYTNNDGHCNAFITCASTGKATVAVDGTTVHTVLKISLSKLLPLSIEVTQLYRAVLKHLTIRQTASLAVNASGIGEVCPWKMDKQSSWNVSIYHQVAAITGSDDDKKPIILTGDLNVNFTSEEANPFIEFSKQILNLTINTDAREGTTMDAVFSRFLD